jgi:hypothetical protein
LFKVITKTNLLTYIVEVVFSFLAFLKKNGDTFYPGMLITLPTGANKCSEDLFTDLSLTNIGKNQHGQPAKLRMATLVAIPLLQFWKCLLTEF